MRRSLPTLNKHTATRSLHAINHKLHLGNSLCYDPLGYTATRSLHAINHKLHLGISLCYDPLGYTATCSLHAINHKLDLCISLCYDPHLLWALVFCARQSWRLG